MFPEGAVIKRFVIEHKKNKPQFLKENKFITRMGVEIQTFSSPCDVLRVFGVFFYNEFFHFIFEL